jgi:hypothetical protein
MGRGQSEQDQGPWLGKALAARMEHPPGFKVGRQQTFAVLGPRFLPADYKLKFV